MQSSFDRYTTRTPRTGLRFFHQDRLAAQLNYIAPDMQRPLAPVDVRPPQAAGLAPPHARGEDQLEIDFVSARHRAAAPAALPAPGAAGKHRGSDKAAHERSGRGRAPFTFQRAAQICDDYFHHIARTVCLPLLPKAFCKGHHGRLIEGLTLFKADFAPTSRVEV